MFFAPATPPIFPWALLGAAVVCDVRSRRIPNWIPLTLALGGVARALFSPAGEPGQAFSAMALGIAVLWVPFVQRWIGAGDVKLVGAAGTWLGPIGTLWLILGSAVLGGLLAAGCYWTAPGVRRAQVRQHLGSLIIPDASSVSEPIPYGVAIAVVAACQMWGSG